MEISINIEDYLSEDEIKSIIKEELSYEVRRKIDGNNVERIFSNSAYHIVWEEVNKQIDYDVTELIRNKVIEIISDMSSYSIFRYKESGYGEEDSLAAKYMKQYIEENKNIVKDKVIEIMQNLNEEKINDSLYDLIYQVVEDRIIGKN